MKSHLSHLQFPIVCAIALALAIYADPAAAQAESDEVIEEIVTTGSRIAGSAEDLPVPVSVLDSAAIGYAPTVAFLIERLPFSSGVANEREGDGAAISGAIFGDHASPISDTTVLASMASATDHIDHVRTQLPYALLAAAIAAIGFLLISLMA